jgi:hypothetical protein
MGSSKKVTTGYKYYMGLHFGICHGPVDSVNQITVGERSAWSGSQESSGSVVINSPDLFGGDSREGGIVGFLSVMMGEPTQAANSYLAGLLGAGIPAFRGILSAVWLGGQVASNNPYVKPWAFRVKRILQGWAGGTAWYPEKAEVNAAASVCVDGYSEYFIGEYSFDPNLAAMTPEASASTVVISGMAATDILQITLSPVENNAWSRWLGYDPADGVGTGYYYDPSSSYPLWWSKISVKDAEGNITRLFDTSAMTAEAAYSANASETGNITGSTSYKIWIEDDVLYNRGSLSVVVKKLSSNGFVSADMNPAHIVYQCLTDTAWGMGYPTTSIDSTSFTAAADTLYSEGFGLSLLWNKQETIESFVQLVLDHIGGMLYVDPATGKFALKLIRDDYVRETLPQYGPTNLISAEDYQRQAWGETVNEITVVYTAPCTGKETATTVQDTANIMTQGGIVAQTRSYTGITSASLAQRVALRDLNSASTPLARIKLTATRAAWEVFPGDVFRLTWPEYDISDVVYRVMSVNRGTLQDGQIIIDAVEDVFGLPDNTYLVDQPSEWEDPSNEPTPAPYRALIETPYWDLVRNLSEADMAYVDSLSGYLETLAVRPSSDAINYGIYTRVGAADYVRRGSGDFCPSSTIVETLTKTTTSITLENGIDIDLVVAGKYAVIENEYVLVSDISYLAGTATISRGVLDTVPEAHTAGSRIWFADGYQGFETTEYADSETVDAKMLTVTGRGELNILLAPADSLTFDQRQYRPYAPGNIKFAGSISPASTDYPSDIYGTLTVSWAHRDRLAQTAYIVEQDESDIGPEAGVTYTVEIREGGTLVESSSGISGTSYTATISGNHDLEITLYSMRGGVRSWQSHIHSLSMYGGSYMLTEDGETRADEAGNQIEQE